MIVVFGSLNADLIFAMQDLPEPGQTLLGPDDRNAKDVLDGGILSVRPPPRRP